jgi:putative phosphoesterase
VVARNQPDCRGVFQARIIGLISDTHGLLREEAIAALAGSDLIIHAGDIGKPDIIDRLQTLAPVVAVKGNIDTQAWASELPLTAVAEAGPVCIYVLHNLQELDLDPAAAGFNIVISGHSHKPTRMERASVLYLNPGSAGPKRFSLPITVARLDVTQSPVSVDFVHL